jgi:hypothetical protein
MGVGTVRLLHTLWPCGMGLVAEMGCAAFEIDTVKFLMSIFVRDFSVPELCTVRA